MKVEESIKILNSYLSKPVRQYKFNKISNNEIRAIETILKEYKEVKDMLAHRIQYSQELEKDLFENASNYIVSKDKIKDKLDKLKQEFIKRTNGETTEHTIQEILCTQVALYELLEEE